MQIIATRPAPLIDMIEKTARANGVDIHDLRVDDRLPQTMRPVTSRWQPGIFFTTGFSQPFYQVAFRWRIGRDERRLMVLDPIIRLRDNGFYEVNHHAMAQQLLGAIIKHK